MVTVNKWNTNSGAEHTHDRTKEWTAISTWSLLVSRCQKDSWSNRAHTRTWKVGQNRTGCYVGLAKKRRIKRAPTLPPARLPVRPSSLNVFLSSDDFHRLSVLLVVLWLHFAIKTFGHGRCCRFSLEMKKSVRHVTKDSPFSPDSPTNCQQGCSPMTTYTPSTQIQPGTRKVKKKGTNPPTLMIDPHESIDRDSTQPIRPAGSNE